MTGTGTQQLPAAATGPRDSWRLGICSCSLFELSGFAALKVLCVCVCARAHLSIYRFLRRPGINWASITARRGRRRDRQACQRCIRDVVVFAKKPLACNKGWEEQRD